MKSKISVTSKTFKIFALGALIVASCALRCDAVKYPNTKGEPKELHELLDPYLKEQCISFDMVQREFTIPSPYNEKVSCEVGDCVKQRYYSVLVNVVHKTAKGKQYKVDVSVFTSHADIIFGFICLAWECRGDFQERAKCEGSNIQECIKYEGLELFNFGVSGQTLSGVIRGLARHSIEEWKCLDVEANPVLEAHVIAQKNLFKHLGVGQKKILGEIRDSIGVDPAPQKKKKKGFFQDLLGF